VVAPAERNFVGSLGISDFEDCHSSVRVNRGNEGVVGRIGDSVHVSLSSFRDLLGFDGVAINGEEHQFLVLATNGEFSVIPTE